jgi:LytS/YehU family sensor histidine kinase
LVTLEQEIERIKLYLSLEAMRFKDKFEYFIETNDVDLDSITIPSMIIQPFVENSIIHGVLPNENVLGKITIRVQLVDDLLTIEIEDNGIGIDRSLAQKVAFEGDHKSQGMEITFKRIDLLRKVSNQNLDLKGPFQITNEDGSISGTMVSLKIKLDV